MHASTSLPDRPLAQFYRVVTMVAAALMVFACASPPPPVSEDGLHLQSDSKFEEVYLRPGAKLAEYSQVALEECGVTFRDHWLRDQNQNRVDLGRRVSQEDMDRMASELGELCDEYFSAALAQPPAYSLAESGPGVLVIDPDIVELDVAAPDIMSPDNSRSFTQSSGEMTLALVLRDGESGEVLARVSDHRRDFQTGRFEWTNSVSNRADAIRVLKRWSELLRDGLDNSL